MCHLKVRDIINFAALMRESVNDMKLGKSLQKLRNSEEDDAMETKQNIPR
jgi:hypothetical protein